MDIGVVVESDPDLLHMKNVAFRNQTKRTCGEYAHMFGTTMSLNRVGNYNVHACGGV